MVWRFILLVAILVIQVDAAKAEINFGRYHALVIGINDYQHLPRLKTAVNDATAVADLLRQKYGFEVTLLLNPTRDRMVRTLDELRRRLTELDNLLIYYAGHGVLDRETETGFWLPVDAEEDTEANWIDLPSVTRRAKAISAKHVMVVADSCYSGTLVRAAPSGIKSGAERLAELTRLAEKRSRTALVSGGLEPVADSGGYGHSMFARAFLTALRENTEVLEGQQLFSAIRGPVVLNADQTPEYSDMRLAGHDGGDFLFVPVNVSLSFGADEAAATVEDQRAIELALWDSVKKSTNAAVVKTYVENYPEGTFAALAKARIKKLETGEAQREEEAAVAQERELWETVKESANPAVLRAYLENYPAGTFAALAKVRITELETADAQRDDEAEATREEELWNSVNDSANPEVLRTYLARYPAGAVAELAKVRITELEALKEQELALATSAAAPSSSKSPTPAEWEGAWRAKDGKTAVELTIEGSSVSGSYFERNYRLHLKGKIDAAGRFSGTVAIQTFPIRFTPTPTGLEWAQTGYRGTRHGCSRPRRSPIPAFATRVPATFPR